MVFKCKIIENIKISHDINEIKVTRPKTNKEVNPGMFFNIKCNDGDYPLLRRPISIGLVEDESLSFFIRGFGAGTKAICSKKSGDYLDIMGPLGNGFDKPKDNKRVLIIGGGIGVAPLLEQTKQLALEKIDNLDILLGFKNEAFLIDKYESYAKNIVVVSEEIDSYDHKGFVTEVLLEKLKMNSYDIIYTCGPKAMLKAVKLIAEEKGIEVQLLMEERMACGMGACLVCTCKVKGADEDFKYVRTCKEGPVFYGREVIFDE